MRVGFARPFASFSGGTEPYKQNNLCTFWDNIGSGGSTYTLTCSGKMGTFPGPDYSPVLSEPKLGRFVTLQKISNPEVSGLNWAEVRVESTSASAELEQEENVRVFVDSAIL